MLYLVSVKFLPGGAIPPEDFFRRINARWSWLEGPGETPPPASEPGHGEAPQAAVCIADFESIEQLTIDLSIMPGAGIANIEVCPLAEAALEDLRLQVN